MITNYHHYFHWIYHQQNKRHWFIIGSGLFTWFFLSLTLPFGIYDHNFTQYIYLVFHLAQYGAIWILINYSADALSQSWIRPQTSEKVRSDLFLWLLKIVIHVHAFLLLRGLSCQWLCIDLYEYLELWLAGFLLFILFYIPFLFYGKYKYYQLMVSPQQEGQSAFILKGGGKDAIAIAPEKILFLKADDNYVDILSISEEGTSLKKTTLRATLKSLDIQLQGYPQFQRVHRSYIVNLNYLLSWEKNELVLATEDETVNIPISSKYKRHLQQLMGKTSYSPQKG